MHSTQASTSSQNVSALQQNVPESRAVAYPSAIFQRKGAGASFPAVTPIQRATDVKYTAQTVKFDSTKTGKSEDAVVGKKMIATIDPTEPIKGSTPSLGGKDQELYDTLNATHGDKTFVRGHLLNDNIGGLGVKENLFPITTSANRSHVELVENTAKALVYNDNTIKYEVEATKNNPGTDFIADNASEIKCKLGTETETLINLNLDSEHGKKIQTLNEELDDMGFGSSGSGIAPSRNKMQWLTTGLEAGYIDKGSGKIIGKTDQGTYW